MNYNKKRAYKKREALNGKIKNRIGKKLNATIENKIVAFVYVNTSPEIEHLGRTN